VNILAFDACFGGCSAAVLTGAGGMSANATPHGPGQADVLMPLIAATLEQAGVKIGDIDRIAVTLGPGGFSGVRVGIAAARGLALATGKPVVGVGSLAAWAGAIGPGLPEGRDLVVAANAYRGELYVQSFGARGAPLGPPHAIAADDTSWLTPGRPVTIAGSGAAPLAAAAQAAGFDVHTSSRLTQHLSLAEALARMAAALIPLPAALPLYVRAPDALPSTVALPARA
jgi:tRNA threonylcarbamoyladenosine biosynthesis protein TsaB